MTQRRLAAFSLPLRRGTWAELCFDGLAWSLVTRAAPHTVQAIERVHIALELPSHRWLRLRWRQAGWRRWWPREQHVWLRRAEHVARWPLIGAALARHHGRDWLGRR